MVRKDTGDHDEGAANNRHRRIFAGQRSYGVLQFPSAPDAAVRMGMDYLWPPSSRRAAAPRQSGLRGGRSIFAPIMIGAGLQYSASRIDHDEPFVITNQDQQRHQRTQKARAVPYKLTISGMCRASLFKTRRPVPATYSKRGKNTTRPGCATNWIRPCRFPPSHSLRRQNRNESN